MTDAADARRVNKIESLQVVDSAPQVPDHLTNQRPARMLAIKRNGVAVMAAGRVMPVTETECVIGKGYNSPREQVQRRMQLGVARETVGFFLSCVRRLMRTNNRRSLSAQLLRNEQI